MPELNNRDEIEARLARLLGRVNRETYNRLSELLGDPPKLDNITEDVWREIQANYETTLMPEMESIFMEAANGMLDNVGIGVEWDLINRRASDWSRRYTFDLVSGINDNNRRVLRESVGDFYEQRLNLGGLQDRLRSTFGPVRAEMIAITETTRAASQGEEAYANELRRQGAELVAIWNTSNDAITCPICSPRNGKQQGDGWEYPPPAHPRCRCWLTYTVPELAPPISTQTDGTIIMPYGAIAPDVGMPGSTVESLNTFLNKSEGPLARALKGMDDDDFEHSLLNINFDTDQWEVNKANVKYQADVFLQESRYVVNYSHNYLRDMIVSKAAESGLQIDKLLDADALYNRDYQYKARAILTTAEVGKVKLTDAQRRRLNQAAEGNYLDMVLTEAQNRTSGNPPKKIRGGGNAAMTPAARRAKREEFLEVLGRLDF